MDSVRDLSFIKSWGGIYVGGHLKNICLLGGGVKGKKMDKFMCTG